MRGPAFFAYANNYLIDVKFGVIMDVEASRVIRQAEVDAAKTMIGLRGAGRNRLCGGICLWPLDRGRGRGGKANDDG